MEIMNRIYAADQYYLVLEVDRCAGGQDELYTSEMSAETRVVQHRPTVVISSVHISIVLHGDNHSSCNKYIDLRAVQSII